MAGPITRSVADAAVMLDALVGYDKNDPSTAWGVGHAPKTYTESLKKDGLKGKRLGVLKTLFGEKDINAQVN
jgi:amidase